MPLITAISDRMIALELGQPIVEGTPGEVTTDPRVVSSYLGGDLSTINRSGATKATAKPARRKPAAAQEGGDRRRQRRSGRHAKKATVKRTGAKKAATTAAANGAAGTRRAPLAAPKKAVAKR